MKDDVETLLDKAKYDIWATRRLMGLLTENDGESCLVAYHLHQALVKAIKHQIEMKGKRYRYTDDLEELLKGFEDISDGMPSKIRENLYVMCSWGSKTRDVKGYRVDYYLVVELIPEVSQYLDKIEEDDRKANEDTGEGEEKAADSEEVSATTAEFGKSIFIPKLSDSLWNHFAAPH